VRVVNRAWPCPGRSGSTLGDDNEAPWWVVWSREPRFPDHRGVAPHKHPSCIIDVEEV